MMTAASMGPHVFACGNMIDANGEIVQFRQLQWGRTFLRAEM